MEKEKKALILRVSPELHDYIKVLGKVTGEPMSSIGARILTEYMENNKAIYEEAIAIRDKLPPKPDKKKSRK